MISSYTAKYTKNQIRIYGAIDRVARGDHRRKDPGRMPELASGCSSGNDSGLSPTEKRTADLLLSGLSFFSQT